MQILYWFDAVFKSLKITNSYLGAGVVVGADSRAITTLSSSAAAVAAAGVAAAAAWSLSPARVKNRPSAVWNT